MSGTSNLREHFIQVRYYLIFIIAKNAKETLKYPLDGQRPFFIYYLQKNNNTIFYYTFVIP
jgi:hypothetical protein